MRRYAPERAFQKQYALKDALVALRVCMKPAGNAFRQASFAQDVAADFLSPCADYPDAPQRSGRLVFISIGSGPARRRTLCGVRFHLLFRWGSRRIPSLKYRNFDLLQKPTSAFCPKVLSALLPALGAAFGRLGGTRAVCGVRAFSTRKRSTRRAFFFSRAPLGRFRLVETQNPRTAKPAAQVR